MSMYEAGIETAKSVGDTSKQKRYDRGLKVNLFSLHMWTVVVLIIWWLDLQLPMQSVPITSKVVSLNAAQTRFTECNIM